MINNLIKKPLNYSVATLLCLITTGIGTTTYADTTIHSYAGQKMHQLNFGGNGIDTLYVTPPQACNALQFSHVEINVTKKRYGKAQIIDRPEKGCRKDCVIKVKWVHKPAGILAYNLHVTWKQTHATC